MKSKIIMLNFCFFVFVTNALAQTTTSIKIQDTRAVNDLPNFFGHGIRADFKQIGTIGVPGQGYYGTNITIGQWDDWNNSGGKNHQLNFNDGGFFYRSAYPMDPQWGAWRQVLMTNENGNVGIGTTAPSVKLDVNGDFKIPDTNAFYGSIFRNSDYSTMTFISRAWQSVQGLNGKAYSFQTHNNTGGLGLEMMAIYYGETGKILMAHNGGNVGIGTTNPTSKLTVAGNINSREVKVSVDAGADFVFEKDYALPSLQEVEKFVTENKHLPEIASAKEMQKEGINLSEMNIKLLQKIEEQTLYLIELSKEVNKLKSKISELEKK